MHLKRSTFLPEHLLRRQIKAHIYRFVHNTFAFGGQVVNLIIFSTWGLLNILPGYKTIKIQRIGLAAINNL